MRPRTLQLVTLLVLLGAAFAANPPPGHWLGEETSTAVWATLMALAAVGGLVSVLAAGRALGWIGLAFVPFPLLGGVPELGSAGFYALLVAAWAGVLHVELATFAQRRVRWAERLGADVDALALYQRAYARSVALFGVVLAAGLVGTVLAFLGLRALAPASFADSVEARHVEGLFAFVAVVALVAVALWLTMRRDEDIEHELVEEAAA